jgi:hypothetical protein
MPLADQGIDEQIAADWEAIREKHATEPETPAPVEEPPRDEPPTEPTTPEESPPVETRARGADGKFVKTEEKPEAVAPVEAAPADASQRDINRPPSTWKPTARQEWDKLPPSVRAEIHRRESDFMSGQHQLLPDAKLGATMRQTIEPYRMLIESEGGTPERAVGDLLRSAAMLRMGSPQQKLQLFATLANQYGVDLRVFGQQQAQGQPQPAQTQQEFRDPRVDQLLAQQNQQEQQRQQRETTERETIAQAFMNEMGTDGKPARPYLGDVIDQMAALVPLIRAETPGMTHQQTLQEAYDRATWANPEIRALLQQEQQAKLEAQRRAANQTAVAGARRAASVNVPRRASTPDGSKPTSLEETIREGARALGLVN